MLICFWDQDKVSTFRVIQSPYPYHTLPPNPIITDTTATSSGEDFAHLFGTGFRNVDELVRWSLFVLILLKAVLFAFFFVRQPNIPNFPSPFEPSAAMLKFTFFQVFVTSFIPSTYVYEYWLSVYDSYPSSRFHFSSLYAKQTSGPIYEFVTSSDKSVIVTLHSFFV